LVFERRSVLRLLLLLLLLPPPLSLVLLLLLLLLLSLAPLVVLRQAPLLLCCRVRIFLFLLLLSPLGPSTETGDHRRSEAAVFELMTYPLRPAPPWIALFTSIPKLI
jgi:hypothetical protein